jgi:hypothetical protein
MLTDILVGVISGYCWIIFNCIQRAADGRVANGHEGR